MNPDVMRMRRERLTLEEYEDGEIDVVDRVRANQRTKYKPPGWDIKSFGENLNPLWRYLQKQVGRPWNQIFSEICENMDRRSAVGGHIFQHLFDFVVRAEEVVFIDGKPHRPDWSGESVPITYSSKIGEWSCFYVDPKTGILKRGMKRKETTYERETRLVQEDRKDRLRKIGDVWMSRHPTTDLWYVLDCREQQYVTETTIKEGWRFSPDGLYVRTKYTHTEKTPVFEEAPIPKGLFVPKGLAVTSCRSANKKDLKKVR